MGLFPGEHGFGEMIFIEERLRKAGGSFTAKEVLIAQGEVFQPFSFPAGEVRRKDGHRCIGLIGRFAFLKKGEEVFLLFLRITRLDEEEEGVEIRFLHRHMAAFEKMGKKWRGEGVCHEEYLAGIGEVEIFCDMGEAVPGVFGGNRKEGGI